MTEIWTIFMEKQLIHFERLFDIGMNVEVHAGAKLIESSKSDVKNCNGSKR